MSYESTAEPIKIGYLMDFRLPEFYPQHMRDDLSLPFELIFDEALREGRIDRPIEIVYREVEGLPKGSVKAVADAFGELVDEGVLAVFGPHISDNCIPTREAIEDRFRIPALSVTGSDDWLGEWTFSFPQGSLTDEPIFWVDLLAKGGHTDVAVLVERSLVGQTYLSNFRDACRRRNLRIVAEATIAQTAQDVSAAVQTVYEGRVHWCTVASASGSSSSIPPCRRWAGIRHGSPARLSRTPGSTRCCGTRSRVGPVWTSTTRPTRWVNASSTASNSVMAAVRNTAFRLSTAMLRPHCCRRSPTPIR